VGHVVGAIAEQRGSTVIQKIVGRRTKRGEEDEEKRGVSK